MSDPLSSHEEWLAALKGHLLEERYHAGNARQCMAAARNFLAFLHKEHTTIADAQPETVERYVQWVLRKYRRRHGHAPAYEGWRCSHTSGVHILLRMVRGRWPPAPAAVTPFELYKRKLCEEFATSMIDLRGLAPETVVERCDEALRFLDWLGEGRMLAVITVADVDIYMKNRATLLRRASIKGVASRLRTFLRSFVVLTSTLPSRSNAATGFVDIRPSD